VTFFPFEGSRPDTLLLSSMRGFWGSRAFLRGVVKLPSLRGLFRPEDTFSLGATTVRYTSAHVTAAPFSLARGLFLVGGPIILVAEVPGRFFYP
jgi:hypothetical protein